MMGFTEHDVQLYLAGSARIDRARKELSQVWGIVGKLLESKLDSRRFKYKEVFATVPLAVEGGEFKLVFRRGKERMGGTDVLVDLEGGGSWVASLTSGSFPSWVALPLREAFPLVLNTLEEAIPEAGIQEYLSPFIQAGRSEQ